MSELTKIPYVGKATAASLNLIGYETIASLKGADPEEMYKKECDDLDQVYLIVGTSLKPANQTFQNRQLHHLK